VLSTADALWRPFRTRVLAPAWALRERSPYLRVAAELRRAEHRPADERRAEQWERLRRIVAYAADRVPFYRSRFASIGFDPRDLASPADLARLPVLSKQDVRAAGDDLLSFDFTQGALVQKRTSGSTGVSLYVYADPACMQRRRGITLYRDRWTGWEVTDARAMVWGNPPPVAGARARLRRALLERDDYLDTLRLDRRAFTDFAARVLRRRPRLLFGHAHSLYRFARFWEEAGLPAYRFPGMISTAMVLHDHERRGIVRVFGDALFDRYGCEETSLIASECEAHDGLHVNTDGVYVELVEDGSAAPPRVVVTDLHNRGMPLIRYEVGDRARPRPGPCPCGRTYDRLAGVMGRVADYLITPRGELVSGISLTENFATLIPGVEQVQVIQDRRDHLLLHLVPAPTFGDESRRAVSRLIAERFGAETRHEIVLRERIDPEPSGKFRFAICRIPDAEAATAAPLSLSTPS
jgi:phenylacetate-CoA ligase